MDKAVFFDRDGVINRNAAQGEYISNWREFEFLPGVFEAGRQLAAAGYKLLVVTNQRGIATGKIAPDDLAEIHERMASAFLRACCPLQDIYCCVHDVTDRCSCRKPQPGMLLKAAQRHAIDLANSWMVGDHWRDIEAGRAAGCLTALIGSAESIEEVCRAEVVESSLLAAVPKMLAYAAGYQKPAGTLCVE